MGHQHSIRVYYEDTDAGGIVYYANYLKFFERARTEWLRNLGTEQDELLEHSLGFVVKRVEMDNHAPARFNQLLCIQSEIVELKRASLVFKQTIISPSDTRLVSAIIKVACVNLSSMKPQAIPANILEEFKRVV
ncbi:MAG: tol-pal system-associated acyl-CoA thioesterase [Paraglaciecola sp.]|uniref:tol-pal system-associated acyl-CoA thioesterase n=1 Tax=Paraglaciecola sp. TaxID=1920173 RepID=UPI00273F6BEB|nr:tol-pal system-associated acyl-CoA thioesterase [Paraglaciecola sp.]MDP5032711.1 tol-pal system-associated acyl-CoA thioesterase [Paraglaciecola sp.]MDP5040002.1 tol-pal system-associated acyl-CoA thioesterase [Paraglaciecola sp.]MDP5132192.1 tol-pal system-associated acyl-CoA thioesterase [Paraglaciecola sp.]